MKTIKQEEEKYNVKINEIEKGILEEQDRTGVFGKSGSDK